MNAFSPRILILFIVFFSQITFASELPDTYGNRMAAARKYLDVVSMKDLMRDSINENSKNFPMDLQPVYIKYMLSSVRIEVIEAAALASMAQRFSLEEINALVAFYGSRSGQSVMRKMGNYMGDVMPVIQQELVRSQVMFERDVKIK